MTNVFAETRDDQAVHALASPLLTIRHGQDQYASGTAVVVGAGYALTAYHVLADFVERYEGVRNVSAHLNITFEIFMYLTVDQGKSQIPLKVLRAWNSPPLDLALLAFGVPQDFPDTHRWTMPRLTLRPPKVGTRIAAFGFPNSELKALEQPNSYSLDVHARTSTGVVQEIHHERRDLARMPFPCFRTDARYDGGMSGGPIFDDSGHLCGIVCSSLPPFEEGESHTSYGCSLWPMVGILLDSASPTGSGGDYRPVMQLFRERSLSAVDLDQVTLDIGLGGERIPQVSYQGHVWQSGRGA